MEEEAMAILHVTIHSKIFKQDKVIIQIDSLLMQKILSKEWGKPWKIADIISQIWKIFSNK